MRFTDLLVDTLRTIWAHKLRTFLTMFGIVWGIVSITLMIAAGDGFRDGQQKVADEFGKNVLIFFPGRTTLQAGGTRAGRLMTLSAADPGILRQEATECSVVIGEMGRSLQVRSLHNAAMLLVTGSSAGFFDIRSIPTGQGRHYDSQDDVEGRRVAFIGSDVQTQLFAGREAIGQSIHINNLPYTVIGIMTKKEEDSSYDGRDVSKVFIPLGAMLRDFPMKPPARPDALDRMLVAPPDLSHYAGCKSQVQHALARLKGFDPADEEAFYCWDTVENSRNFAMMTEGMKYFLGAVGIVTLFLGGIGVMNVMLVAVRERTREIGVRKAVGATSGAILRQFFAEALIIVFLSGTLGMAIAYAFCGAINMLPMPRYFSGFLPSWESGLLSFSLLSLIAILSAIYPASRAAAIDPIEALRHEAGG